MITPLAVVVLAVDAIIIGVLMVRAMSLGMFREMREKSSSTRQEQSKALIFTIIGLGIWTGVSGWTEEDCDEVLTDSID